MPEDQLKVRITGDAGGIEQAAQKAADALGSVESAVKSADVTWKQFVGERMGQYMKQYGSHGAAIKKIAEEWNNYKATISSASNVTNQVAQSAAKLANNAAQAGGSIVNLKKGSGEVTQSLINLSRVAQDAPYGFIGIANNINPLLESFQRLQKETGSTKSALSALGSSLMGAGGLGLVVGIASSLLVVFGDKLFSAKSASDELADSLKKIGDQADAAGKSLNTFSGYLDFLNQASKFKIEIAGGLDSQAIKEQIDNTRQSIQGVKSLRDQLKQDKGQINLFDFKVGTKAREEAENALDKFDKAIQESIDKESELSRQEFALQQQLKLANIKEQKDAADKADEIRKKALQKNEEDQREALRKLKEYLAERSRIIDEFSKDFEEIKIFSLPDVGDPKDNKDLFDRLYKNLINSANKLLPIQLKIPVAPEPSVKGVDLNNIPLPLKIQPSIQMDMDAATNAQKQIESLVKKFNDQLNSVVENAVSGFGENIGAALAGGSFENVFKGIVASAGDFLQQLGKILIQTAIKIELFKKALYVWAAANPALAVAAGVGLIAAGAIIKNTVMPKPKGFAAGGIVSGPVNALVGEGLRTNSTNPEVISPLSDLKKFFPNNNRDFPDYLPAFSMTHDQFRLWYRRAETYGNTFGR